MFDHVIWTECVTGGEKTLLFTQKQFCLKGRNVTQQVHCDASCVTSAVFIFTDHTSSPAVMYSYNVPFVGKFELNKVQEAEVVSVLIQVCRSCTRCCRTWPRRKQPLRVSTRRISVISYNTSSLLSPTHHILRVSSHTHELWGHLSA